jgi:hypothetical protein
VKSRKIKRKENCVYGEKEAQKITRYKNAEITLILHT